LNLQSIATVALRNGLMNYDKRKGWRGPLANKKNNKEWFKNLDNYKLEKSINWELAIVKKINKFSIEVESKSKENGVLASHKRSWTKKETIS
jgi:penicillin-binding protein 1A